MKEQLEKNRRKKEIKEMDRRDKIVVLSLARLALFGSVRLRSARAGTVYEDSKHCS